MKPVRASFQKRLLRNFLVAGVIPLVACVALILGVFQASLAGNAESAARTRLAALTGDLNELAAGCDRVLAQLAGNGPVSAALAGSESRDTGIYSVLYSAAAPLLRSADFSLYDAQGRILYTTGAGGLGDDLPVNWGLLGQARTGEGLVCRRVSPYDAVARGSMQLCRGVKAGGDTVGYAVAELDGDHLSRLLEGKYGAEGDVVLLDAFWDEVYASPTLREEGVAPRLRSALLEGGELSDGEGRFTYHVEREALSGFTLVLRQPKPLTDQTMRFLYGIAGASILLCLLLCVRFSLGFSRRIFEPIRALNAAMAQVEEGDLEVRMEVTGTDEISQLSGRFNRMTQRLGENLRDSVRQQQELGDAQIRMMQAQLNPHFLYNTLDTLKWLGKINRVEEVSTISADLADILRRSISAEEFVRLGEDLALLERYVEIQKIRFPGKFEYRSEVDEELLDALVPKLMLQPLVENAIIHGFEDGSHGHITLTAESHGEEMLLTVRDDGVGMSEESRQRFLAHAGPQPGRPGHLGIYNVDAILRLHYGPDRGLVLLPTERGTCIRAVLPIIYEEKEDGA